MDKKGGAGLIVTIVIILLVVGGGIFAYIWATGEEQLYFAEMKCNVIRAELESSMERALTVEEWQGNIETACIDQCDDKDWVSISEKASCPAGGALTCYCKKF